MPTIENTAKKTAGNPAAVKKLSTKCFCKDPDR